MLDGREELDRVQRFVRQVLRNIPRELPNAFEDELGDARLLRARRCTVARERLDDPQEQCKERPEISLASLTLR